MDISAVVGTIIPPMVWHYLWMSVVGHVISIIYCEIRGFVGLRRDIEHMKADFTVLAIVLATDLPDLVKHTCPQ